jgi:hypothetical protein
MSPLLCVILFCRKKVQKTQKPNSDKYLAAATLLTQSKGLEVDPDNPFQGAEGRDICALVKDGYLNISNRNDFFSC